MLIHLRSHTIMPVIRQACVFVLMSVLVSYRLAAQTCNLDSPLTLKGTDITAPTLQRLLEQHRTRYSAEDVLRLRQAQSQCQIQLDKELKELESKASNLSLVYQDILGFKDVAGLKKTIADLKESRNKSKEELEQNLARIKHYGLFVVMLKSIDTYASRPELTRQAIDALTSRAVEDLNGSYVRRFSQVMDYRDVSDIISSMTSGEVYQEKEYFSNPNFKDNYFVYIGKISVTPLKKSLKSTGSGDKAVRLVLNLDLDKDWQTQLRAQGVSQTDLDKIISDGQPYLDGIRSENENATERQRRLIENGQEKIVKIDRDIADAENRLATRRNRIGEYCKRYQVPFDEHAIDQSVQRLLDKIKQDIEAINKKWNSSKEREILGRETRHTIEGDPIESIAGEVIRLVENLRAQYRTVQKMEERIDVENLQVVDVQSKREVQIYREIEQVWVYPVPRDDGSFGLHVFTRFRITDQRLTSNASRHPDPIQQLMDNMVRVSGGTFTMGCTSEQGSDCDDDEKPTRRVTLSDFRIGRYEVTQAQWRAVMGSDPSELYNKGCDQCPVERVSWEDVQEFIRRLNIRTGGSYRLPTEAEWEYAARGGSQSLGFKYSGSSNIDEVAWYESNARPGNTHGTQKTTRPVGQKKANELGLHDMSGNVWEWCADWNGSYATGSQTNPKGPSSGSLRVGRGGGWFDTPRGCRVSIRNASAPTFRASDLGFRLASS
jgi:formylglycine-generating enzyme required for sulfatase activity